MDAFAEAGNFLLNLFDAVTPFVDAPRAASGIDPVSGEKVSKLGRLGAGILAAASVADEEVKVLSAWHKGTFATEAASAAYHVGAHGRGRTLAEYTADGTKFFNENKARGVARKARDGSDALLIRKKGQPGGWFTPDGKSITFWYK